MSEKLRFEQPASMRARTVLTAFCSMVFAPRDVQADPQRWPIVVAFLQEATVAPVLGGGDAFVGPLHPGMSIGTEVSYVARPHWQLLQTFNLGFYSHRSLQTGVFALTEFGPRAQFAFGLGFDALLGVGYLHTFSPMGVYGADAQGVLRSAPDAGHPHALVSLAVGTSYEFPERWRVPLALFLRYQLMIETPAGITAILPHTMLQLGIRISLARRSTDSNSTPR